MPPSGTFSVVLPDAVSSAHRLRASLGPCEPDTFGPRHRRLTARDDVAGSGGAGESLGIFPIRPRKGSSITAMFESCRIINLF